MPRRPRPEEILSTFLGCVLHAEHAEIAHDQVGAARHRALVVITGQVVRVRRRDVADAVKQRSDSLFRQAMVLL